MKVTLEIHDSWLNDNAFHYWIARAARLSKPRPAEAAHEDWRDTEEGNPPDRFDDHDRGDAWEPPGEEQPQPRRHQEPREHEPESPPTDGRQLLGWAGKQIPDAKGPLMTYGKKRGLPSKIVTWSPEQVEAAYRFLRARQAP